MKKIISIILLCVATLTGLSGCVANPSELNIDGKINIVCTTFAQYDWVSNIIMGNEENVNLVLLMDKGGDLHNFQPSALDIARVSGCDIFIYVGGESDTWVYDALSEAQNKDIVAIDMMETLEEYDLLYEDEHDHGEYEDVVDNHGEYDEHVWLSLKNAAIISEYICEVISRIDYANASLYRENCDKYVEDLVSLDDKYMTAVAECEYDTLIFADRFPFRYMCEDYGIKYYAAFDGCSAETEAGFITVASLSDMLSELGLGAVSIIDGSNDRLARVIIENSNQHDQRIVVFNSMQSVSASDMENGMTYLSAMEGNLEALKEALY